MKPIRAVYEKGVFRPIEPVDLPEHTEVEVQAKPDAPDTDAGLIGVRLPDDPLPATARKHPQYRTLEILSHRYDTGESDLAERHDEHQP